MDSSRLLNNKKQESSELGDIYSQRRRSEIMSRVRGHGNRRTELRIVELFRQYGIRGWRRNARITGQPDFVFPSRRVAIFVDGCFWHCCSKHGSMPATNRDFWMHKLAQNKLRDRRTNRSLRSDGWRVLRIWQHELTKRNERPLVRRLRTALFGRSD